MATDPAEYLLLLARRQAALTANCPPGPQRFHAKPRLGGGLDPFVDRRTGKAVGGNDCRRGFAFPHPLNGHQPNGFQRLVIETTAISFHPSPISGLPVSSNIV